MGQNATGKSTLMLLASGRLLPDAGFVSILDKNSTDFADEMERNGYISYIYQNMEFETEESILEIMHYIYASGFHQNKDAALIDNIISVFELSECLNLQLQNLSKGQMQRAILSFSLLYGSKIVMMDEPIFALEDHQKQAIMRYLVRFSVEYSVSFFYSVHELEISENYADHILLLYRDGRMELGPKETILTTKTIEDAFEYPRAMLYQREQLYRNTLLQVQSQDGFSN